MRSRQQRKKNIQTSKQKLSIQGLGEEQGGKPLRHERNMSVDVEHDVKIRKKQRSYWFSSRARIKR